MRYKNRISVLSSCSHTLFRKSRQVSKVYFLLCYVFELTIDLMISLTHKSIAVSEVETTFGAKANGLRASITSRLFITRSSWMGLLKQFWHEQGSTQYRPAAKHSQYLYSKRYEYVVNDEWVSMFCITWNSVYLTTQAGSQKRYEHFGQEKDMNFWKKKEFWNTKADNAALSARQNNICNRLHTSSNSQESRVSNDSDS